VVLRFLTGIKTRCGYIIERKELRVSAPIVPGHVVVVYQLSMHLQYHSLGVLLQNGPFDIGIFNTAHFMDDHDEAHEKILVLNLVNPTREMSSDPCGSWIDSY
jgi:hypothetical protein